MTLPGGWDLFKIIAVVAVAVVLAFTRDEEAESPDQAAIRWHTLATLWIIFGVNVADVVLPSGWSTIRSAIWTSGGVAACVMVVRIVIAERRELRAEREAAQLETERDDRRLEAETP